MLRIILPQMAGFSEQQGTIFGFGPKATEDTGMRKEVLDSSIMKYPSAESAF